MTYYLCTIAKRKNARRHIVKKCKTMEDAKRLAENINKDRYKVQICSGDWVETYHIN